ELQNKRAPTTRPLALRPHAAAVGAGNGTHNKQPQAGSRYTSGMGSGRAVKTFKDLFQFAVGYTDAVVLDAHRNILPVDLGRLHADVHFFSVILHGVVDEVRDRGAHF